MYPANAPPTLHCRMLHRNGRGKAAPWRKHTHSTPLPLELPPPRIQKYFIEKGLPCSTSLKGKSYCETALCIRRLAWTQGFLHAGPGSSQPPRDRDFTKVIPIPIPSHRIYGPLSSPSKWLKVLNTLHKWAWSMHVVHPKSWPYNETFVSTTYQGEKKA